MKNAGTVAGALFLGIVLPASAVVFMTRDEALVLAFGESVEIRRRSFFLTDDQIATARDVAGPGVEIESSLVARYEGWKGDRLLGTAYFDSHVVRTLPETIMVVITPEATIARVEILAFGEPRDYRPNDRWLDQFEGRGLDGDLAIKRGIRGITGATLSSRAVTDAARRILAIHHALDDSPPEAETP